MKDISHIVGCENVFITEDGRVFRNGKEKACQVGLVGYRTVNFSINNKSNTFYIHRLLLQAFVGNPEKGQEVLHKNGNRLDNSLENLRWGTRSENVQDAILHGTANIGTKSSFAKLTKSCLGWIKDMNEMGFKASEIAPHFNVTYNTINRVLTGKTFKREFK
jgi:hypothetical protein